MSELINSLKPIYENLILNREKKYEYRTIKPKKLPKRICLPNCAFYRIKEPITLKDLKSKFGFSAPQSFAYLDKYNELHNYLLNKAILEKIY